MELLRRLTKGIEILNDLWERVVTAAMVIMTSLMVVCISIQIISRTLNYSLIWTSDVATFLFAWMAFLGAAVAVRDNEHFIVDIYPTKLKTLKFNVVLNLISLTGQFVIGYIMVRYGASYVGSMALRFSNSLGIRLSYIVSVVPISGCLVLLATFERLLKIVEISKPEEEESHDVE